MFPLSLAGVALLGAATAGAAAAATTFVIDEPTDLILAGGATLASAPVYSLRSGNPGQHTSAGLRAVLNPGASVSKVSFTYSYDTGFGPTGVGSNFTLLVAGKPVYASPHFVDYQYSHVSTCSGIKGQ